MRRQTPPADEPADALLAARVAALEDGLAVACAAIAHLKGLAESATVAATAASAATSHAPLPLPNKRLPKGQQPKAETATEWPPLMQSPPKRSPSTGSPGLRIRSPRPLAKQLAPSCLHSQIEAFVSGNDEAVTRQAEARQAVFELIAARVREAWPSAEVVCYGSMRCGLSTPASDIDVVVLNAPAASASSLVTSLALLLEPESWVCWVTALAHAAVPLLKLQCCTKAGDIALDADISVAVDYDHQGIQATTIVREELGLLPSIRPLLLVVKTYLCKLGLNITWTGGLSSHALFLMARTTLPPHPTPLTP